MRVIILSALMLTFFACTNEQPTQKTSSVNTELARQAQANNPETSQSIEVDMTAKHSYTPPAVGVKESESFKRHFTGKEQVALLKLKQTFEAGMCEEQRTAKNLKACYEGHAQMIRSDFSINYFCLDATAKVMEYYKEIAQENGSIHTFTESYIKNKSLTQDLTTNLLMSIGENMDFNNFDHQLFYTILHLTWNEENKALKKLK